MVIEWRIIINRKIRILTDRKNNSKQNECLLLGSY